MKKVLIFLVILAAIATMFFVSRKMAPAPSDNAQNIQAPIADNTLVPNVSVLGIPAQNNLSVFVAPLKWAGERVTKKPFGIFITPQTSPVQPEKFRGYHTGADFEIFPEELNADVSVHAVCDGKMKIKEYASGYGGVMVEDCTLNGNPITVIYGHLKLASIQKNAGDSLLAGEVLGILGADKSAETDGERKHLHLGFHNGTSLNILGYVQNKSELSGWIDPCPYVCF